jgi:hypothetical protein
MKKRNSLDAIDQCILRILSAYEEMATLELWYEIGEDDAVKEGLTEAEIRARLDSLSKKGLVEKLAEREDESAPPVFRIRKRGVEP